MLDFDLAILYEVQTRVFKQAVKRDSKSFPKDVMFQLTKVEWDDLKYQIDNKGKGMSSQIGTTFLILRNCCLHYSLL